jgi:hypothetical protein
LSAAVLQTIADAVAPAGLFVRGGFHVEPADDVPPMPDGQSAGTVVLVGNAGAEMWDALQATDPGPDRKNPLDSWLRPRIQQAAASVGAHPIFPNEGPPFVAIQDWARRAEPVTRSPIGLMIHPTFGLWHVYRAALCFAERIDLPPREDIANPCETCAAKPCLKVCPADAFGPTSFDVAACLTHVESDAGGACRDGGCMARRACPIGRDYLYPKPAQKFHTAAFMRAAKRHFGRTK